MINEVYNKIAVDDKTYAKYFPALNVEAKCGLVIDTHQRTIVFVQ